MLVSHACNVLQFSTCLSPTSAVLACVSGSLCQRATLIPHPNNRRSNRLLRSLSASRRSHRRTPRALSNFSSAITMGGQLSIRNPPLPDFCPDVSPRLASPQDCRWQAPVVQDSGWLDWLRPASREAQVAGWREWIASCVTPIRPLRRRRASRESEA